MGEFTLKKVLKKKKIVLSFLFVCSLFISLNAFSWGRDCCIVSYEPPNQMFNENRIKIFVKFFEFANSEQSKNAFLYSFKVKYSTNGGHSFKFLMSASSRNKQKDTWAWIDMKEKRHGESIYLYFHDHSRNSFVIVYWENFAKAKLLVDNHEYFPNQTWLSINWHPKGLITSSVTHIQILANWSFGGDALQNQYLDLLYPVTLEGAKLNAKNTNFSNLSSKQEIRTEDKDNTVKAYKNTNSIVVKGALCKKILVYTTSGRQVTSIVADNDIVKIQLSPKQVYIVNIGQTRYKVTTQVYYNVIYQRRIYILFYTSC